jgi:hemolysin activation/secretion protein
MLLWAYAGARAYAQDAPRAAGQRFDVFEYQVEGNTVLPVRTIERAVYSRLGEKRSIDDVEEARASLERAYHEAGYPTVLVSIPEQKVDQGIVRLAVTEGRISRARVVGAHYYSQEHILETVAAVAEGNVPKASAMQAQLNSVNRTPDRRVTPVLRPGREAGTTEIDLNVEDRLPLHGSLQLDNRYSPNTTPLRLSGGVRYENLWQREHSLSLQFQTAPADTSQVKVFSLSYAAPLPGGSDTLAFYALRSDSAVGTVGGTTVLGKGNIYGARYVKGLQPREQYAHTLTFGVDYKSFQQDVTQGGTAVIPSPVHYLPFTAQYSANAQDASGISQGTAGIVFALRNVGSRQEDFDNKRFLAQTNFAILRWDLQRTQTLPHNLSLFARFDGQAADQPLINNEQFIAGGAESVRGYLESEQLGDMAFHGTVELRSPSFAKRVADALSDLRAHVFIDGAALRLKDPLPAQRARFELASAGLGLRLKAEAGFALNAGIAWPIKDTTFTTAWRPRVQFLSSMEF